jgi:hypothetical protein
MWYLFLDPIRESSMQRKVKALVIITSSTCQENLYDPFGGQQVQALSDVNFEVEVGEL